MIYNCLTMKEKKFEEVQNFYFFRLQIYEKRFKVQGAGCRVQSKRPMAKALSALGFFLNELTTE